MLKKYDLPEDSFIQGWYFKDDSICDDMITFFRNNPDRVEEGHLIHYGEISIDHSKKKSYDIIVRYEDEFHDKYHENFIEVVKEYRAHFPWCDNTDTWGIQSFQIQYYPPPDSGFFDWHCERNGSAPSVVKRHLVFMTYLNDVVEGGETEFLHQKLKIKPEKGLTLIWPVDWTHTHRGIAAPKEEKFIVTGWLDFQT